MIAATVERCAGIDVGRRKLNVCVLKGPAAEEPEMELREFGTDPASLEWLRRWLLEHGCTHVVMESTGSYWKPVFEALEQDLAVVLANGEDVKGRRGHKSDWQDCRFLGHLLRHGLIRPSFIPPRVIRDLRDLTRRRRQLIGDAVSERNRVQKVLDEANVGIGQVLGDILGVSGQLMLEKLLAGETDVEAIANLAQRRAKQKIPELIRMLEGHRLRDHHRRLLRFSLEHLSFLESQVAAIDAEIAALIEASGLRAAYQLLSSVPGVQQVSAAAILAETGADMNVFPTPGQLSSWAGVAPGNKISGGKASPASVSRGNRWLRSTLVECAWAASKLKDSPTQAQFARLAVKGRKKALIAVAHSLILMVHRTLASGQPWQPAEQPLSDAKRQRLVRHHIRRLGKLGVQVYSLRPEPTRLNRNPAGTVVEVAHQIPPNKPTPRPVTAKRNRGKEKQLNETPENRDCR